MCEGSTNQQSEVNTNLQVSLGCHQAPCMEARALVIIVCKSDSMHRPMLGLAINNVVWKRAARIPPAMQLLRNQQSISLAYHEPR